MTVLLQLLLTKHISFSVNVVKQSHQNSMSAFNSLVLLTIYANTDSEKNITYKYTINENKTGKSD